MKNAVIAIFLLLTVVSATMLLNRDPVSEVRAQAPQGASDLSSRMAALEEFIALHSHERELQGIRDRLKDLEAASLQAGAESKRAKQGAAPAASRSVRTVPNREIQKLQRDVQSLSSKLSSLDRMFAPIKQDIAKLKLGLSRLESSVAGIDLRR